MFISMLKTEKIIIIIAKLLGLQCFWAFLQLFAERCRYYIHTCHFIPLFQSHGNSTSSISAKCSNLNKQANNGKNTLRSGIKTDTSPCGLKHTQQPKLTMDLYPMAELKVEQIDTHFKFQLENKFWTLALND